MALTQLQPGYRLDRYEILWPIAHGGMASVYAARMQGKHGFEKLVAIKTILPQLAGDPRLEKMFLDEARIVSGIRHPNVAEIFDVGEQEDILYMVFEWVDGDSLSTLRRVVAKKKARMPIGVVLRMMADACAGLHAAHELTDHQGNLQHVVHRDVSPQNIMVTAGGTTKVIDFGVAKAVHRLSGETNDAMLKGKVQYMAPEQALGQSADRRADVWAAGAVLYQLVSDRLPYEGDNPLVTLHMLMSRMPPAPLPPWVPGPVSSIIHAALAHDPRRRYQTAAEMQTVLENVIQQLSGAVTPADVARYIKEHISERIAKRRQTLQLAMEAARERESMGAGNVQAALRVTELNAELAALSSPGTSSKSGLGTIPSLLSGVALIDTSSGVSSPGRPAPSSTSSLAGTPGGVPIPITVTDDGSGNGLTSRRQSGIPTVLWIAAAAAVLAAAAVVVVLRVRMNSNASGAGGSRESVPAAAIAPTPSPPASVASATVEDAAAPGGSARAEATAPTTATAPPADTTAKSKGPKPVPGPGVPAKPPATAPPTGKDPLDVFGTR
jgi:serine/threonine-protein kinase